MDITTINKPIIMQSNVDTNNNPFVSIIPQVDRVTKCLTIITNQVINEDGGVEILSPSNLIQVYDEADLINYDNRYMVLADRAQIKFSENLEGQYIFFRHYGDGTIYMSANRIYTKLDSNGNIIETLDDIVEAVRKGIELFKTAEDLKKLSMNMDISLDNAQVIITNLNNSVVLATQTNNTLKTTTDNAKTEDATLNTSINTAKTTDKTLNDTNTNANNTNTTLNATITTGNQLNANLTDLNDTASQTKADLDTSNTNALATKGGLDTSIDTGNTLKTGLDNDITTGNTLKTALEADISSGNTLKTGLETDISNGNTLKTGLDNSISTGNTLKSGLDTDITNGNTLKSQLETAISNGNITQMQTDISNKQDKTDNTFTTTNKTVSGAVNELNSDKANDSLFVGMVATFPTTATLTGWLKCNGALVSRTSYARLFAIVGTSIGAGDGSTTFALPNIATANGLTYYIRY